MPPSVQAQCGVVVGRDWPMPVVDLQEATRSAKARLHARRNTTPVRQAKQAIVDKHASRKRPAGNRQRRTASEPSAQTTLDF
jgi:deoxyribodipyrimidine photo-lyase